MRTLLLGLLLIVPGCATPPGGWDSPDPAARLRAINTAANENDRTAIPRLIESLQHDDPVVRMWAIRTLEQMTGQTRGYDYAAPEWQRQDAVAAWAEWYKKTAGVPDNAGLTGAEGSGSGGDGPIEGVWRPS